MQKKFSNTDKFWVKEEASFSRIEPSPNWWFSFLKKIKNKFWANKKTNHLQKTSHSSKIIAFTPPTFQIEIKSISVSRIFEPSIHFVFFTKETTRIHIFLRDTSKKIIHQSSHLILQGERDFSLILKNEAQFEDGFFIQIQEASGKSQTKKIQW